MYPKGYKQVASIELSMTDWDNAMPYTSQAHEKRGSRKYGQLERYKAYKEWLGWQLKGKLDHIKIPRKGEKVYLYVHCYFKDYTHGDPENVRKAIQDAIYGSDKYVAGCVDFGYDKERPRVVITILEPATRYFIGGDEVKHGSGKLIVDPDMELKPVIIEEE